MIIGLMPIGERSLIYVAGLATDQEQINDYIAAWTRDPFQILALAETWMINGTDQWYLAPSVWEQVPIGRQRVLLNAIMSCDQNSGQELALSIFDGLRTKLLSEFNCTSEFVEKQKQKMS